MNREKKNEISLGAAVASVSVALGCRTCGLMGWDSSLRK
jgi:hypothetical protein